MPVTIDEVTAQVESGATTQMSQSPGNQNHLSPEMELRRYRELQNHIAIRLARLRAE
jgi:hypothetical protein